MNKLSLIPEGETHTLAEFEEMYGVYKYEGEKYVGACNAWSTEPPSGFMYNPDFAEHFFCIDGYSLDGTPVKIYTRLFADIDQFVNVKEIEDPSDFKWTREVLHIMKNNEKAIVNSPDEFLEGFMRVARRAVFACEGEQKFAGKMLQEIVSAIGNMTLSDKMKMMSELTGMSTSRLNNIFYQYKNSGNNTGVSHLHYIKIKAIHETMRLFF